MTKDAKDDIDETLASFATVLDKLEQRYKEEEKNMAHGATETLPRDAGSDDEPRDPQGRWTSGGGGEVQHPDIMESSEGSDLASAMETVPDEMHESLDEIRSAHEDLASASSDAEDVVDEEEDILDEHGSESKEYADWEKRVDTAKENVADKAMALHKALSDHMAKTKAVLDQLTSKINKHAKENGVRGEGPPG